MWLADSMMSKLVGPATMLSRPKVLARVRELIESQPAAGVAWAQRAMAARPDSFATVRAANVPALVIVGEQDTLTPPSDARALAEALPGSHLAVLPGAGHLTPLEDPDGVAKVLLDWLE